MSYTPPLESEVTAFKTTTPLASGATFTSSAVDVNGYSQVQTEILASHDGTIAISFCADSGCTDVVRSLSIPYVASGGYQFFAAPAFGNFIEYNFTNNGTVTQTDFYYTTKILTTAISPQLLTTEAFISPSMVTSLGRNIQVGTNVNGTFVNSPNGGIDDGNSTTTPLSGTGVFNGTFANTDGYVSTSIFVKSDQDSATDGFKIIHSSDGVTDERVLSFSYISADNPQGLIYLIPSSTKYFRLKYINGAVAQTGFTASIKFETSPQMLPTLPVNIPINNNTLANTVKSVIVGKNDAGTYNSVVTDNQNNLKVDASNNRLVYDEFPILELSAVSQLTFPYNINTDLTNVILGGSGTVTQADNMAIISTSTAGTATESSVLESVKTINYRAGEGALGRFSALFTDFKPNGATSVQGFGLGDSNNGYGFIMIGTSSELHIAYRTNGVQTTIAQSLWNEDTMDGDGNGINPSGMLLDPTKGNVYQVSYGSGFGCVYFSIESQSTGQMVLVHVLKISNLNTTPSTYNPVFALRAEVFKDGTADANDYIIKMSDMSSFTQGKNTPTGVLQAYDNTKNVSGTETSIFSIQNKSTVFGGAAGNNRTSSILQSISMYNDTNGAAVIRIWEDTILGGSPSYVDINSLTSISSIDIAGTTRSGGKLIWVGGVAQTGGSNIDVKDLKITMRSGKTYTFTAQSQGGSNPILVGAVWVEDF